MSLNPRENKIIIDAKQVTSASPLKPQATMIFSPLLNWFRFPSKDNANILRSKYFIFSPLLQNERQSFPLVWHQQGKLYLSLPGEIAKQLNVNTELLIKQDWQLSLINQENAVYAKKLSLGFFGAIFISADLPTVKQLNKDKQKHPFQEQLTVNSSRLGAVSQLIQQYSSASQTKPIPKYKLIVITDNQQSYDKILTPVVNKLLQNDYAYQSLLTLLFAWLLLLLGITLIWCMRNIALKQQSISVFSYIALLLILQYILFNQQHAKFQFKIFDLVLVVHSAAMA